MDKPTHELAKKVTMHLAAHKVIDDLYVTAESLNVVRTLFHAGVALAVFRFLTQDKRRSATKTTTLVSEALFAAKTGATRSPLANGRREPSIGATAAEDRQSEYHEHPEDQPGRPGGNGSGWRLFG